MLIVRTFVGGLVLAVLASTGRAEAERGFELARHGVETPAVTSARAQSRTVYLNHGGVTLTPGSNDARTNRSSVPTEATTIPAWSASPELWSETVACIEDMFAPFDVTFTDVDPGSRPHIEAVFGGTPSLLGLSPRIGGIAPMSTSCAVVENAMVFTFTGVLPQNARVICEVMAQEIAHSYGLDHEVLASDPMSYLRYDGERAFQDELAACGESTARPCGLQGSTCREKQNSYALLLERLGAAGSADDEPDVRVGPPADDPGDDAEIGTGCSAAGGSGGALTLAVAALLLRRRRRRS